MILVGNQRGGAKQIGKTNGRNGVLLGYVASVKRSIVVLECGSCRGLGCRPTGGEAVDRQGGGDPF